MITKPIYTRQPGYDATTLLSDDRLAALLGLPFRYCDRTNYKPNPYQPGYDGTGFTTDNLAKAMTFDGRTLYFLDTTIEGLVAIDALIHRLRITYRYDDPRAAAATELATVIHEIATEVYPGFDDLIEENHASLPEEDEEDDEDEEGNEV
jgi:hypothetical protein